MALSDPGTGRTLEHRGTLQALVTEHRDRAQSDFHQDPEARAVTQSRTRDILGLGDGPWGFR